MDPGSSTVVIYDLPSNSCFKVPLFDEHNHPVTILVVLAGKGLNYIWHLKRTQIVRGVAVYKKGIHRKCVNLLISFRQNINLLI